MREVNLELDRFECPSNNQVRSMNSWVYKKIIDNLKKRILVEIGEGPWPKVTFEKSEFPSHVRRKVIEQLQLRWPKRRMVMADITIRRTAKYDPDNSNGGAKPLWDALTRMGWMVDDRENWFWPCHRQQVLGDPKVVLTLYIPEDDKDEKRIKALIASQANILDSFREKNKNAR